MNNAPSSSGPNTQFIDQARDGEHLRSYSREELVALIAELRTLVEDQGRVIEEIVDERDAARLLNELCHF